MLKLEDIRREYTLAGLKRTDLNPDPMAQFEHWMQQALSANLSSDPTAMTVATVNDQGQPTQRIVLLKKFDTDGFVFYTNLESQKAQNIAHNAQVSLHFPWLQLERQVIVAGIAEKISDAEATKYFLTRPYKSQIAAWASHQSQTIESRAELEKAFKQLENTYSEGNVPKPEFWGGYRVKPTKFEFWQGRGSRLHDRFSYQPLNSGWEIQRLQP